MFEKRKLKKIQELAKEQNLDEEEYRQRKKDYRRKNLISDLKKTIPGIFYTFLAFLISYEILKSSVGGAYSLMISIPSLIFIYIIMWGMISRTYSPAYEKFIVCGHVDPENKESAWMFQKWMIPRKIVERYFVIGTQFSLMTTEGLMFFCEYIDFDHDTGTLKIRFGWPKMDEFAFLTEHGVFHNMKEIMPLLLKKIQQLEANMEVLVHLQARDLEEAHFKRIMHVMLDMTRAKAEEDLEILQREIDKTNEQINIRLKPKGTVPEVDRTAGGEGERKTE